MTLEDECPVQAEFQPGGNRCGRDQALRDQRLMRRAVAALTAAVALAAPSGAASAPMPQPAQLHVAQTAWQGSPCTNRIRVYWDDALQAKTGFVGAASGIHIDPNGTWHLVSCDITLDVSYWLSSDAFERCQILVHEAGHLAGLRHTDKGIMRPDHDGSPPACRKYQ